MAEAGESVYQGREGTGEAQIFRPFVDPYGAFVAGQEQRRAGNAIQQEKFALQNQQKRNADLDKYINANIGKNPGWFQQENSVDELNKVRSTMEQAAFDNPGIDARSLSVMYGNDRNEVLRRIGKRTEIQKEIEQIRTGANSPNSLLDTNWITTQANRAYDSDIDKIDSGSIVGLQNHPRAFDAEKSIVNSVKSIASQSSYTGSGEPQDIGFGIQIDGYTKKVRFKTDDKGRVADETVDFVLDANPNISQRLRWDYARQMAGVGDDTFATPEQMKKIQENFNQVRFSDSPEVVRHVRNKIRQSLEQLQKYEYVDRIKIQNKPKASGDATTEDVNNRMIKILAVKNALKDEWGESHVHSKDQQTKLQRANDYIAELKGIAKHNGMPVTDIQFVSGEKDSKTGTISSVPRLKIMMKSGVEGGDVLEHTEYISVDDPGFEEIMNNLWNSTSSTTKEKKITGNSLRGDSEYLYDDDDGFLDE